jgi:hypothetical protein
MGLLAKEAVITVTDYGLLTGVPAAGSSVPVCGLARNVRNDWTREETEQTALCDDDKVFRPTYSEEEISMEVYVPSTGFIFRGLRGKWIRVAIDPDGAGSLGSVVVDGYLTSHNYSMDVGGSQMEQITLRKRNVAFS